jgi:hypothetical protein
MANEIAAMLIPEAMLMVMGTVTVSPIQPLTEPMLVLMFGPAGLTVNVIMESQPLAAAPVHTLVNVPGVENTCPHTVAPAVTVMEEVAGCLTVKVRVMTESQPLADGIVLV